MNFLARWIIVILLSTFFSPINANNTVIDMPILHTNSASEYELNEVQKGIQWLENWYRVRKDMLSPDGRPFLTEAEYQNIAYTLKNLGVSIANDIKTELRKKIQNGVIKFKNSKAKYNALMSTDKIDRAVGLTVLSSTEPHVLISPKELLNTNLYWEDNKVGTISGSLSKAVVHEATHAATYGRRHETVINQVANADKRNKDPYFDMPSEIYACLNELRYSLGKDPSHIFTLEEIKDYRAKLEQNLKDYQKEVKSIGKRNIKNEEQLPLQNKAFDHHIFSRYTDEQIVHMLNDVVQNTRLDLDEEHMQNRIQDVSYLATIQAPVIKPEANRLQEVRSERIFPKFSL